MPTKDKMWESWLRWFRHVKGRTIDADMNSVDKIEEVCSKRGEDQNK